MHQDTLPDRTRAAAGEQHVEGPYDLYSHRSPACIVLGTRSAILPSFLAALQIHRVISSAFVDHGPRETLCCTRSGLGERTS